MALAIVVLAGAAMAAAWLDPAPPPLSGSARASDGDSFHLGAERVRLLGIDAPELDQTCKDASGRAWTCGHAARTRLAAALEGGPVDCQPEGRDQYHRILAVCQVKGLDIGRQMIVDGLAISSGRYFSEEQQARSARRGIWAGSFDTPRSWRDGEKQVDPWGWIFGLFQ